MSETVNKDSNIKYVKEDIEKFLSENSFKRVYMSGMCSTIKNLKEYIDANYTDISYMTYDIGFHGWVGEEADNMYKIDKAINKRIIELYAICLAALGENLEG